MQRFGASQRLEATADLGVGAIHPRTSPS
jgi:hypothetical protein